MLLTIWNVLLGRFLTEEKQTDEIELEWQTSEQGNDAVEKDSQTDKCGTDSYSEPLLARDDFSTPQQLATVEFISKLC